MSPENEPNHTLGNMNKESRSTYTVMAGCGVGEFLWRKDTSDSSCLVGGNVFSLIDQASDQDLISAELFDAFRTWAMEYMAGQPKDWADDWNIDWSDFHAKGMRLARQLKAELGSGAIVQYVRPNEDPSEDRLMLVLGQE